MKTTLLSLVAGICLLFSAGDANAQRKIYFCSDYTSSGEPIGISPSWVIKPEGGKVYMLYKNDGVNISTGTIYIYVDKLSGGTYTEYATKSLTPDKYKSWCIYDYTFTEAGDYKVTFVDAGKKNLATDYVSISMKESTKLSSDYYSGSRVIFCEDVTSNGDPITKSDVFNIGRDGGYVYVLVDHLKELKTTEIIVDIWKGEGYTEFVETKRFTVEDNWVWTKFKYTFYAAGDYKISVYNKDEVFINTGYVTINYK